MERLRLDMWWRSSITIVLDIYRRCCWWSRLQLHTQPHRYCIMRDERLSCRLCWIVVGVGRLQCYMRRGWDNDTNVQRHCCQPCRWCRLRFQGSRSSKHLMQHGYQLSDRLCRFLVRVGVMQRRVWLWLHEQNVGHQPRSNVQWRRLSGYTLGICRMQ